MDQGMRFVMLRLSSVGIGPAQVGPVQSIMTSYATLDEVQLPATFCVP